MSKVLSGRLPTSMAASMAASSHFTAQAASWLHRSQAASGRLLAAPMAASWAAPMFDVHSTISVGFHNNRTLKCQNELNCI